MVRQWTTVSWRLGCASGCCSEVTVLGTGSNVAVAVVWPGSQVSSGIASRHCPSAHYQVSDGRTSGGNTGTQRARQASRYRSCLTPDGA